MAVLTSWARSCWVQCPQHDPVVIRKLLAHLGMARSGPSPGPAPPESTAAAS